MMAPTTTRKWTRFQRPDAAGAMPVLMTLVLVTLICGVQVTAAGAEQRPMKIVAFGDSLTAGFGVAPNEAFPVRLQAALTARGHRVEIVNAGVSGDTTAAGLERLDWAVGEDADGVILELGANDALRGLPPEVTRANLEALIVRLKAKGMPILLAGMKAPRNWGEDYARSFDAIFPDLAARHGLGFYPFFLEGVAVDPSLNQDDGMHPNARGVDRIVAGILPSVEALIGVVAKRRGDGT
ncbi:MAG: arylesterase [Hyphomicrobiaceae bacterium]|nr:arylesterase [Hyphomicrobiaceae bacterium]